MPSAIKPSVEDVFKSSSVMVEDIDRLSRLPFELILEVIDHLSLHDKFNLSHTSRLLRTVTLKKDWPTIFDAASHKERVEFLTEISKRFTNRWVCSECCKMHFVKLSDVPTNSVKSWMRPLCVPEHTALLKGTQTSRYQLHYQHVQLALKYKRLLYELDSDQIQHLGELIAHFAHSDYSFNDMWLQYEARPQILDARFFLHEKWVFRGEQADLETFEQFVFDLEVCPHLYIWPLAVATSQQLKQQEQVDCQLEDALQKVFEPSSSLGEKVEVSCRKCLTSCEIFLDKTNCGSLKLVVASHRNLGCEGSGLDPDWLNHVPWFYKSCMRKSVDGHQYADLKNDLMRLVDARINT